MDYFLLTILSFILSVILSPFVVIIWVFYGPYRCILYMKAKKMSKQYVEDTIDEEK